jgi:hypothetical protein
MIRVRMRTDRPIVLAAPDADLLDVKEVAFGFPAGFTVEEEARNGVPAGHS